MGNRLSGCHEYQTQTRVLNSALSVAIRRETGTRENVNALEKTFRVTTRTPRLALAVGLSDMGMLAHSRTIDHPTRLWVRSLHRSRTCACGRLPRLLPGTVYQVRGTATLPSCRYGREQKTKGKRKIPKQSPARLSFSAINNTQSRFHHNAGRHIYALFHPPPP